MAANTGRCVPQLSHQKLEEDDDLSGTNLLTLMSSASDVLAHDDTSAIKQFIANIKVAIKSFETANRALSAWLTSCGFYTEASETRSRRLQIVHQDCRELLRNLNSELTDRNEDAVSSIGGPSTIAHSFHPLRTALHPEQQASSSASDGEVNTAMSQLNIHDNPSHTPAPGAPQASSPGDVARPILQTNHHQEPPSGTP